jgi:predicted AlkP superfamily phosphohydrolase/phosphomutase
MLVFTGTDRLMHFLWEAYEDPGHKYHNCFLEHFRKIDAIIGEISKKLTSDDLLIILSDHGFERLDKDVYINYFLQQEEFLKFQAGQKPNVQNLDSSSKAFALDPARIYINTKGKYPGGSVNPADKEKVIKSLEDIFSSWEIEGKSPIKRIYRKQEVYSGPFLDAAPDLILMANQNFNLKSSLNTSSVASKGIFTGKHTFSDAFILVNDQNLAKTLPENPDVSCLKRLL